MFTKSKLSASVERFFLPGFQSNIKRDDARERTNKTSRCVALCRAKSHLKDEGGRSESGRRDCLLNLIT